MMKFIHFAATAAIAVSLAGTANATITCTTIGQFTNCSDSSSGTSITCTQIGQFTSCN